MEFPKIVDFAEGGAELIVAPEHLAQGSGIPILANRQEMTELAASILGCLSQYPQEDQLFRIELPFELQSMN